MVGDNIRISAIFHDLCRRGIDVANFDSTSIDRDSVRRAVVGDLEIAAGIDGGGRGDAAVKHSHGIIFENDAVTGLAAGDGIGHISTSFRSKKYCCLIFS